MFNKRGRVILPQRPNNQTIAVTLPTKCTVMVYKSDEHTGWNTVVTVEAIDVETLVPGNFGSTWKWESEPTKDQIRRHVVDFLDHEVRHQLGMDPHGLDKPTTVIT